MLMPMRRLFRRSPNGSQPQAEPAETPAAVRTAALRKTYRAGAIAEETVAKARAQTASHGGPWKGEAELAAMK